MRRALAMAVGLGAVWALCACAPKVETGAKVGNWGFVDGMTVKRDDQAVKNTDDKEIYLNERYLLTGYRVALPNGAYTVTLHFAETYEGIKTVGQRVYSVALEGETVLKDFDPFKEAGEQRFAAIVKTFPARVEDGELTIDFAKKVQNTMINGIEVFERTGCPFFPRRRAVLRINCGAQQDYTDKAGCLWKKDQEFKAP